MKKTLRISLIVVLLTALFFTSKYSLKYMHWYAKSQGYPDLYNQANAYPFIQVPNSLLLASRESLAQDVEGDGDILNWPDARELFVYPASDTVWIAVSLHQNLDLNEPMMSMAIEHPEGRDWYGTVDDFKYKGMVSAGYVRKGDQYYGYNFLGDKEGVCVFGYDLASNTLYLGLPVKLLEPYQDRRFVVSVGQKAFWNDDFEKPIEFSRILP